MMNLVYTLLILAAGMLVGSAGVFIARKKTNHITKVFLWIVVMIPLLVGGMAISLWSEEQAHPRSLLPILSQILVVVVFFYGIFQSLTFLHRDELKDSLKKIEKVEWVSYAAIDLLRKLPLVLWLIFAVLAPWDYLSSMFASIALSLTAISALWLAMRLVWLLKYGFSKTAL